MPSLSIVTALKDGLEFFRQTAPTILNQSFRDWEWLIIDDSSIEPIEAYVRQLADSRIIYVRNHDGAGQTRSLNLGIRQSRSEWIVRMDGDDLAQPERLARIHERIEAMSRGSVPAASLIYSDYDVIHEDGSDVATVRYNPDSGAAFYDYLLNRNNPICHPTVAFKKHAKNGSVYQYDENLRNAQDYALWKTIYRDTGQRFAHLAVPLIRYRLVRQSLSNAKIKEQQAELEAIRAESTAQARSKAAAPSVLSANASLGMYAYRVLYYRFVGHASHSAENSQDNDMYWLARALFYPSVWPKAAFYGVMGALAPESRRLVSRGIFI